MAYKENWVYKERIVMLGSEHDTDMIRHKLKYCVQVWNPIACHGNWSIIIW